MRIPAGPQEKASWGPELQELLDALPGLCAGLTDRWSIRLGEPFATYQVSLVVPADGAEIPAVIKIPLPAKVEIGSVAGDCRDREAAALQACAANGATELQGDRQCMNEGCHHRASVPLVTETRSAFGRPYTGPVFAWSGLPDRSRPRRAD